jgi:DNA-binding transcriptional ArsR family regulator
MFDRIGATTPDSPECSLPGLDMRPTEHIYHLVYISIGLHMPDPLSAKFAALADPTRRAMLARLALGELTLADLARPLAMTIPAVAKHLAVLERAGFVTRSRSGKSVARPAKLQVAAFSDMADWIEKCRVHWEGSFDRLTAYLEMPEPKGSKDA